MVRNSFKPVPLYSTFLVIMLGNLMLYNVMRPFWYFIDRDTKTPIISTLPFTLLIHILYGAFFLYVFILLQSALTQGVASKKPALVHIVLPILMCMLSSALTAYLYDRMNGNRYLVINYLKTPEPYLFLIILLFLLIFTHPAQKTGKIPLLYVGGILLLLLYLYQQAVRPGTVTITSGPNVSSIGNGQLGITWTTSLNSTAFVEYGPDAGHLKTAFETENGLISGDTHNHRVTIPCAKGSTLIYRIISKRIKGYYQNNAEYGNTTTSSFRTYRDTSEKEATTFYMLTDVHENTDLYKHFLGSQKYDFAILGGDMLNSMDTSSEIIRKLLKPLSKYTKGERPVFMLRGNHETRGAEARSFSEYLSLPDGHYYYTFRYGPMFGIVLDSCEDKLDNHPEYSGLADFYHYRQQETAWLQKVYDSNAYQGAKFRCAFIHIPLDFFDGDPGSSYLKTFQQRWGSLLNGMKVDVVFSGHTHVPAFVPANTTYHYPTIIGGGEPEHQAGYKAVKTVMGANEMTVYFEKTDGSLEKVFEKKSTN